MGMQGQTPHAIKMSDGCWIGRSARLGRRWGTIHKLVYGAILLALFHFALTQKLDWREPILWGTLVVFLLGFRIVWSYRESGVKKAS